MSSKSAQLAPSFHVDTAWGGRKIDDVKARLFIISLWACMVAGQAAAASYGPKARPHCQILDHSWDPLWEVQFGYTASSDLKGYGSTDTFELGADWEFAYFYDVLASDIDLNLRVHTTMFLDSGDIQLPDQVVKLYLDMGWTWRNGANAIQARVKPGLYSDIEEMGGSTFFLPFSIAGIRAFAPTISGIAGLEIRPSFERNLLPCAGIEWQIHDTLNLQAQLPESRLEWRINDEWRAALGFLWESTDYALREKSTFDRKQMTLEYSKAGLNVTHLTGDGFYVGMEIGRVFDRTIEFQEPGIFNDVELVDTDIDMTDATYVSFMINRFF